MTHERSLSRRIRRVAFWFCVVAVALAHVAVVLSGLGWTRLWEDEAYNLTVPLNLVHGLGYTSNGYLGGGGLIPFDTRISTGPVVLLPIAAMLATGIDPVLGGRLVMMLFYIGLLAGLWLLGLRLAGRWGALNAITAVLALDLAQLPSPVQGPTDVLGEIPAAALIVWALVFLERRPWLAGLLAGLSVQSKTLAALAVPALGIGAFVTLRRSSIRARAIRCLVFAGFVVLPTVAYEVAKLVTLGFNGYVANVRAFGAFLRDGGQQVQSVTPIQKFAELMTSWFVPWWVIVLVIVVALVIGLPEVVSRSRRPGVTMDREKEDAGVQTQPRGESELVLAVAAGILTTWLLWWFVSLHTPDWIRYPSTALLVSVPIFSAYVVRGVARVWQRGKRTGRRVSVVAAAVLVAVIVAQVVIHVPRAWTPMRGETLAEQRVVASAIKVTGITEMRGAWGVPVSIAFLANVDYRLLDVAPKGLPLLIGNVDHTELGREKFHNRIGKECGKNVLVSAKNYVVCR